MNTAVGIYETVSSFESVAETAKGPLVLNQHSPYCGNHMPNRVIKIKKRRVRFRRFVDKVQSLAIAAVKWISKQWRKRGLDSQMPERVIRIGKVSAKGTMPDSSHRIIYHLSSSKESAGAYEQAETDLLHSDFRGGEIWLTAPPDGATVPYRPFAEGRITNPRARVWVIVHPMEVSDYWVQPPVSVREDGSWRVQIFIGRPGVIDVGKRFELIACGNPYSHIEEAMVLSWWPEAECSSQVIDVIRG